MSDQTTQQESQPTTLPQDAQTAGGAVPGGSSSQGTNVPPAHVPGWKTTEFWMTTLSNAGLVLAACCGVLPAQYAALAAALSQVAYNISRGLAKSGAAK